ncbi:hypothetical protein, partial [Acidithiobacillus thiooxidans]|uniref:hypothetical protein n=1 Tax=Acidithiobacillus thiooxidans TaxID=930 RepID=UPI00026253C6
MTGATAARASGRGTAGGFAFCRPPLTALEICLVPAGPLQPQSARTELPLQARVGRRPDNRSRRASLMPLLRAQNEVPSPWIH